MPRNEARQHGGRLRGAVAAAAVVLGAVTSVVAADPAVAAGNPYQRGPDPTTSSIAATRGTFATAELSVAKGNGFGGGTATWAKEGAWLASFGIVVNPAAVRAEGHDGYAVVSLYDSAPATTEKAYLELAGAAHSFPARSDSVVMRKVIPWLKIFVDRDTGYGTVPVPVPEGHHRHHFVPQHVPADPARDGRRRDLGVRG